MHVKPVHWQNKAVTEWGYVMKDVRALIHHITVRIVVSGLSSALSVKMQITLLGVEKKRSSLNGTEAGLEFLMGPIFSIVSAFFFEVAPAMLAIWDIEKHWITEIWPLAK